MAKRTIERVTIRMYRVGIGDCFLVRLFAKGESTPFKIVIDCGVHTCQSGGADRIRAAVDDLVTETDGEIDVLVVTHEHWDHVSGFSQAKEQWLGMKVGELWAAWTENTSDKLAKTLLELRPRARSLVSQAAERLVRVQGAQALGHPLTALSGFFGDSTGAKLAAAGAVLRKIGRGKTRYRKPGEDPIELLDNAARVFVLGPPRDRKLLKRDDEQNEGATYSVGTLALALDELEQRFAPGAVPPFDDRYAVPLAAAAGLHFFQQHYFADRAMGEPREREDGTQSWRRIDTEWAQAATTLALKFDGEINNTSLVLAIELGPPDADDNPVLLFVGDAQVGNWGSWKTLAWSYRGREVTSADLLARTTVYKVGHHGSGNATLSDEGLELMENLEYALLPTDVAMAEAVRWEDFPASALLRRLKAVASTALVRTDRGAPKGGKVRADEGKDKLWFEVEVRG